MDVRRSFALQVYADTMQNAFGLYFWHYSGEGDLIFSTCPHASILAKLFEVSGCKTLVLDSVRTEPLPVIVADQVSLHWLAVPLLQQDRLAELFLLGPTFSSYMTEAAIMEGIRKACRHETLKQPLQRILKDLPTLLHTTMLHEAAALNYLVTGEPLQETAVRFCTVLHGSEEDVPQPYEGEHTAEGIYAFELEYFNSIAEGNIHYRDHAPPYLEPKFMVRLEPDDPLRQAKIQMLIKANLASRAAIRGGLPPGIAFSISDKYVQLIECGGSTTQIYEYGRQLYQEFLQRVHSLNEHKEQERDIKYCLAYLEDHLMKPLDFKQMALDLGYNRQYLSAKFKKEMGCTMGQYLLKRRLEQAKILLRTTQESISDIGYKLQFSSVSYFGSVFHRAVGMSPSEYRNTGNIRTEKGRTT